MQRLAAELQWAVPSIEVHNLTWYTGNGHNQGRSRQLL